MIKLGLFEGVEVKIDGQDVFLFLDRKQLVKVVREEGEIRFYSHWLNVNCADSVEFSLSEISSLEWEELLDYQMDDELYRNLFYVVIHELWGIKNGVSE